MTENTDEQRQADIAAFKKSWPGDTDTDALQQRWQSVLTHALTVDEMTRVFTRMARAADLFEQKAPALRQSLAASIGSWETLAIASMDSFDPQNLVRALTAYRTAEIAPSNEWMDAWQARAGALHDTFGAPELDSILFNHSVLARPINADFLKIWTDRTAGVVSTGAVEQQRLAGLLWGLAVQDVLRTAPEIRQTARTIYDALSSDAPARDDTRQQLANACNWFGWTSPCDAPVEDTTMSARERKLNNVFTQAGLPLDQQACRIESMGHKTDFALRQDDRLYLIEFDGRSHFVLEAGGEKDAYKGSTLLQSALIRQHRPDATLVRIPYHFSGVFSATTGGDALTQLLAPLSGTAPAAYKVEKNGDSDAPTLAPLQIAGFNRTSAPQAAPGISIR